MNISLTLHVFKMTTWLNTASSFPPSPPNVLLQSPEEVFMEIRCPLEWHCKQMDHFVGLNFSANFNFALVGHLLKGNAAAEMSIYRQSFSGF